MSHMKKVARADPIFDAIKLHKKLRRQFVCAEDKLDETGLKFCKEAERAWRAQQLAGWKLARTKPKSVPGIGALVAYTRADIIIGETDWHMVALKSAAAACAAM